MYSKASKMNSVIIKKTFFILPLIYINHNRQQIFSYFNKYFSNFPLYNKFTYEINKKYFELRKKL
jgi:hypothetical protein